MKKALLYSFLLAVNISCSQSNAIAIYHTGDCVHREVEPSILFEVDEVPSGEEIPPRDNSITKGTYLPAYVDHNTFKDYNELLLVVLPNYNDTTLNEQFRIVFYDSNRDIKYSHSLYGIENSVSFFNDLMAIVDNEEIRRLINFHLEMISMCEDLKKYNDE